MRNRTNRGFENEAMDGGAPDARTAMIEGIMSYGRHMDGGMTGQEEGEGR